jgi:hypothetical protein
MGTTEHFRRGQSDPAVHFEKCENSSNDGLLSTCPLSNGGASEAAQKRPPDEAPDPTPDPPETSSATGSKADNNGIPFMVTQDMKRRLRLLGYTDDQIADMRPDEAHKILVGQGSRPAFR